MNKLESANIYHKIKIEYLLYERYIDDTHAEKHNWIIY